MLLHGRLEYEQKSGAIPQHLFCSEPLRPGVFFRILFLAAALAAAGSVAARADLTVDADTSGLSFGTVTPWDLNAGFVELAPSTLSYALRLTVTDTEAAGWTVYTRADTPEFSSLRGGKPCGDLQWRLNTSGGYTAFTNMDSAVTSGSGNGVVDLDFKLLTDWFDAPDAYGISVIFTVVQN